VLLTGAELSLFTAGFLPGDRLDDRLGLLTAPRRLRELLAEVPDRINAFLAEAVEVVGARFGGQRSSASLPFEGVDWTPFDVASTDAGYRSLEVADRFRDDVGAFVARATAQASPPRSPSSVAPPIAAPPTWAAAATPSSNGMTTADRGAYGAPTPATRPDRPPTWRSCWTSSRPRASTPRS
jgi:hypothetical protein